MGFMKLWGSNSDQILENTYDSTFWSSKPGTQTPSWTKSWRLIWTHLVSFHSSLFSLVTSLLGYILHPISIPLTLSTVIRVIFLNQKLALVPPLLKIPQFLTGTFRMMSWTLEPNIQNPCVMCALRFPSFSSHCQPNTFLKSSLEMPVVAQLLLTFRRALSCAPDPWFATAGKVAFWRIFGNVRRLFGCHTGMPRTEARHVNNVLKWWHGASRRRVIPSRMPSMRDPTVSQSLCLYLFSPTLHLRLSSGVNVSKNVPLNTPGLILIPHSALKKCPGQPIATPPPELRAPLLLNSFLSYRFKNTSECNLWPIRYSTNVYWLHGWIKIIKVNWPIHENGKVKWL